MTSQHVLIAEQHDSGHRLMYVRLLVEEALRKQRPVSLLLGFARDASSDFSAHLSDIGTMVTVSQVSSFSAKTVFSHATTIGASHVVVPNGDTMAMRMGLRGRTPPNITGSFLIMRPPDLLASTDRGWDFKKKTKAFLLDRADRVRGVKIYRLRSALSDGSLNERDIRDPISIRHTAESVAELRHQWGVDEGVFWFGVIGAISSRKNLPTIVAGLRSLHRPVGLLIAGKSADGSFLSPGLVLELEQENIRVVQIERTLTDLELDSAVAAVDCTVMLHSNEGPSGILGKSVAVGTRVVAGGALSLQDDLARLNAGVWIPLDVADVRDAFRSVMSTPRPQPRHDLDAADLGRLLNEVGDAKPLRKVSAGGKRHPLTIETHRSGGWQGRIQQAFVRRRRKGHRDGQHIA